MAIVRGEGHELQCAGVGCAANRAKWRRLRNTQAILSALLVWVGQYKVDPIFSRVNSILDLTAAITLSLIVCTVTLIIVRMKMPELRISDAALASLVFIVAIGAVVRPSEYGFIKALTFATASLGLYIAGRFLSVDNVFRTYLAALLVSSIYVLLSSSLWGTWVGLRLLSGASTNYIGIGQVAASTCVISYMLAGRNNRPLVRALLRTVSLSAFLGVLVSAARGPFVALICTMAVLWLVRRRPLAVKTVGTLGMVLVVVVVMVSPLATPMFSRLSVSSSPSDDPSIGMRLQYYSMSLSTIAVNPLGVGTGQFSALVGASGRSYPHNIILEVGVENGWLGLAMLAGVLCPSFVTSIRTIRKGTAPVLGLLFILALTNAMFSGDLNDQRLLWSVCGIIQSRTVRGTSKG